MGALVDLTGKRFGKLRVLARAASAPDNSARWLCECDCGGSCVVRGRSLRSGKVRDCGCESVRFYDLTGQRFGRLTAMEKQPPHRDGATRWLCVCDCGNTCVKRTVSLRSGKATDCGCISSSLIDLTGQRFGKLTVLEKQPPRSDGKTRWLCACDCGETYIATSYDLRSGPAKSCGCGKLRDLAGQRFGKLIAIERSERFVDYSGSSRKYLWKCLCDCGETVYRLPEKLRSDVNSACEKCTAKQASAAMLEGAGFTEGTQLSKIASTRPTAANKSGVRGVFFNKRTGKWRASLRFRGENHYLGEYHDKSDAVKARLRAEERYFEPILERYGITKKPEYSRQYKPDARDD